MNRHALVVLEFERVLETIAGRSATPMGRAHVLGLRPGTNAVLIGRELDRVAEILSRLDTKPDWSPPSFPDISGPLRSLEPAGAALSPAELSILLRFLASSRELSVQIEQLVGPSDDASAEESNEHGHEVDSSPHLCAIRSRLPVHATLEQDLSRIVDEEGLVRDDASTALRRIRTELRALRGTVVQKLEKLMDSLPDAHRVDGASVSIRDGRYVIPVRREAKSSIGGIIRGESATGASLFVEPPLAIQLMNELHDLEREEAREIERLLDEATGRLRPLQSELADGFQAQIELDSLSARALTARAWKAAAPRIDETGTEALQIVDGRHPLLLGPEGRAVPFSLTLDPQERVVVVSGPNTGGKTVLLKTVGLIHALAQSGVIPPVGEGTRLPLLRDVFADIGDEQSIAESLSTFSAHVENARQILAEAGSGTLVLIDELGTGTDPTEGAALARVILEALVESGAVAFVTSHLGALKQLDSEGSGIVNASLLFDAHQLAPTYQLQKGRPGRSFGLAIARRLGFPDHLLDRAEAYVDSKELRLEALLQDLETRERELEDALETARVAEAEAKAQLEEAETRVARLGERERTLEASARDRARHLLLEARQEVEAAIGELEGVEREGVSEVATRARRRIEEAARKQQELSPRRRSSSRRRDLRPVASGDRARLLESGTVGVVRETREDRVTLEVGGVKLQVPREEIEPVTDAPEQPKERPTRQEWTDQGPEVPDEVDLRGLRVDEVELHLERALDGAIVQGLSEIRIIHGLGTGAVKARVREILETDPRIGEFRPGRHGEGGAGVTVAVLR